jgi:PAS domain S-box-containing protein
MVFVERGGCKRSITQAGAGGGVYEYDRLQAVAYPHLFTAIAVAYNPVFVSQTLQGRKMSEIQSTAMEAASADILRCMPEALIFSDLEGIIRIWNHGAETVFGFSVAEAVGQSLDLIIPERLRKAHWDGFNKAIQRGGTIPGRKSLITRSLHKSGEQIYVDMSFAMVTNEAGKMLGSMAVARDATARFLEEKNLRRQLVELTPKPGT